MKTITKIQLSLMILLANIGIMFNSCNSVNGQIEQLSGYQSGNSVILTWNYEGFTEGVIFNLYRNGETADYFSYTLDGLKEGANICIDNSPAEGSCYYTIEYTNPDGYEVITSASTTVYFTNDSGDNNDSGNNNGGNNDDIGNNNDNNLTSPSNVNAYVDGNRVKVTWSSVSGANGYKIYRASSSNGYFEKIGDSNSTSYYDNYPMDGTNYYRIKAYNSSSESEYSSYAYCSYAKPEEVKKPSAPTGVTAESAGPPSAQYVCITWNEVENATSYKVYRATSANGYYSQIGYETTKTLLYDYDPELGKNYYKVKAINSAGESEYSSYASCSCDPNDVSPCPVQYGNCSATSTTITLRWTNPTTSGCGKPDKAILRVRHPDSGQYADLQTLSGTATSASFSFGMWLDDNGYVYCGIITENEHGSSSGVPKVYDYNNKRWIN